MSNSSEFTPNWASMPGDTIADILSNRKVSLSDFSKMMDSSLVNVKMLVNGFIAINEPIAKKLHDSLGGSIQFWLRREELYRSSVERLKETEGSKWLTELPIKDMLKNNWIDREKDLLNACLDFFKVPDVWSWRKKYSDLAALGSFRKSAKLKSKPASLATWIRQGEIQSDTIDRAKWNPHKFKSNFDKIKSLTRQKDPSSFILRLRSICSESGVIIAVVPTPEGCTASGAAKFLSDNHALIILSFRYRSDDHLWFTFFHESGHLLLHGDKDIFIDEDIRGPSIEQEEKEANDFALDTLFPGKFRSELQQMTVSEAAIKSMANEAGVSTGIIVGQLQYLGRVSLNHFNKFKRKYDMERIIRHIT